MPVLITPLRVPLMNAYDHKHLELLQRVHSGQWREIPESDSRELQVLVACKYVAIKTVAETQPRVTLTTEGLHYLERLAGHPTLKLNTVAPARATAQMRR